MKISASDINREGFAVLHGKWGGKNKTLIFSNPKSPAACPDRGRQIRNPKFEVGYLAYPSPKLKNDIPNRRFYKYDSVRRSFVIPTLMEGAKTAFQTSGRLEQSVSKSEYIKKILQIKELLAAGEIYQLNYAIRFRKKFKGSSYALFLKLNEINPTDFSAYLNCGDFQIISSSPERLFKVQNGKIITQPIKGTADKKSLKYLLNSEKERAELDMITDLERNDVGKICKYGTLKLAKEREVLELKNIWHTYSEVQGKLQSNINPNKIISAMFPGGSITGCPKKRAMKYIEKLEKMPRNIFTGSIGYVHSEAGPHPAVAGGVHNLKMDFNIAIRTALVHNGYIEYWAGGGIVADSNPKKEYEECMLKAEKFLGLL